MTTLDEIRTRDAALHYCATCGRKTDVPLRQGNDPHTFSVEECEARSLARGRKPAPPEDMGKYGYGPLGLCWSPEDHHPFVEADMPNDETEADRRWLLRYIDSGEAWRAPFTGVLER